MEHEQHIELHLHTKLSAMDALTDVDELFEYLAQAGCPAVAITDYGNVQAFPTAWKAASRYGLKLIYGLEAEIYDDTATGLFHLTLLAQNPKGLENLYRLLSCTDTAGFDSAPAIPKGALLINREGLLVGSGCACGELFAAVLAQKPQAELVRIASFYDYLELQPLCNHRPLIEAGSVQTEDELRRINKTIAQLAKALGKPLVATGDVHFLKPADELARRVLLYARSKKEGNLPLPLYYKTTAELLEEFSYLGEAAAYAAVVTNPQALTCGIEAFAPMPAPYVSMKTLPGDAEKLACQSTARAVSLYGEALPAPVLERLSWELDAIRRNQLAGALVLTAELAKASRAHGFPVGLRGTLAASFVAYLLGCSPVNPLPAHYICASCKHAEFDPEGHWYTGFDMPDRLCPVCGGAMRKDGFDIPAETCFGLDGSKPCEITLNFAKEYLAQAAEQLKKIAGTAQLLRAGHVRTMSGEAAAGYLLSYMKVSGILLAEEEFKAVCSALTGIKLADELHPGRYFVLPEQFDITKLCPVACVSGERVARTPWHALTDSLFSISLLSHPLPSLLHTLYAETGVAPEDIPLDDPAAMQLFKAAGTAGLPEFGAANIRSWLSALKPSGLSDLIKIFGLAHGSGTWADNAEPLLKNECATLKEVVALRDDIFITLQDLGMQRTEAYRLMELAVKGSFRRRAADCAEAEEALQKINAPAWYLDSLLKLRYLLPKAHAAVYALQSYQLGWYKAHYPAACRAAVQAYSRAQRRS